MSVPIRHVLDESRSIAVVLLAWSLLSLFAFGDGRVQFAVLLGGLVMAGLYAVVRGVAMAARADPAYDDRDAESVLRENGRAALAGGPWFLLALLTAVLWRFPAQAGLTVFDAALLRTTMEALVQAFALTGAFTVLLVAVASGTRAVRSIR